MWDVLLSSCENVVSDKLLFKVVELQQALVRLTNDKAELATHLDTAIRKNNQVAVTHVARQQELDTLGAVVKEREVTIANLR